MILRTPTHKLRNIRGKSMHRRAFLAASAATAMAVNLPLAATATEGPSGATAVPLPQPEVLPLGPLPNSRYPDSYIEALAVLSAVSTAGGA